jgi:hypothetical protein
MVGLEASCGLGPGIQAKEKEEMILGRVTTSNEDMTYDAVKRAED